MTPDYLAGFEAGARAMREKLAHWFIDQGARAIDVPLPSPPESIASTQQDQDHDEANVSCWCAPTVECPTCGLGPLCKDDDHVKVIIHKEPD